MSSGGGTPRLLVQNGEYGLVNNGDLAMLQVTLERLRERWPQARIGVLTSAPLLLSARHPGVEPVTVPGPGGWPRRRGLAPLAELAGMRVSGPVSALALEAVERPQRLAVRLRRALRPHLAELPPAVGVPDAVRSASLVVAMGGGYLTDVDAVAAVRTLDLLEAAADRDVPTAMLGQGIGPLDDPALRARAADVLPRVGLIALREARRGPALLEDLGVPASRVVVTGDDAIELARRARTDRSGTGIGVCLRIAEYSPVGAATRDAVRDAVRDAARAHGAELVPLIISEYRSEDRRSTLPLVDGFEPTVPPLGRYVPPELVARRVGTCRVLVTGAYHLAVFALSQGIPVVGLSSSVYYDDKLHGLADMFGGGLTVLRLDEPDLRGRLAAAVEQAWAAAPTDRERLRRAADHQVDLGRAAFARLTEAVESHGSGLGSAS